jgi:hypothetical protein
LLGGGIQRLRRGCRGRLARRSSRRPRSARRQRKSGRRTRRAGTASRQRAAQAPAAAPVLAAGDRILIGECNEDPLTAPHGLLVLESSTRGVGAGLATQRSSGSGAEPPAAGFRIRPRGGAGRTPIAGQTHAKRAGTLRVLVARGLAVPGRPVVTAKLGAIGGAGVRWVDQGLRSPAGGRRSVGRSRRPARSRTR